MVIRYHPGCPGPIRPTTSGLNLLPVGTAGALPQAIAIAAGRWRLAWHNGTLFANGAFAHAVPFGSADSSLTVVA